MRRLLQNFELSVIAQLLQHAHGLIWNLEELSCAELLLFVIFFYSVDCAEHSFTKLVFVVKLDIVGILS